MTLDQHYKSSVFNSPLYLMVHHTRLILRDRLRSNFLEWIPIVSINKLNIIQMLWDALNNGLNLYFIELRMNICPLIAARDRTYISTDFLDPIHWFYTILYTKNDQKLLNSLHGLLNCEIGGLDCRVITTEYRPRVQCIHMHHLFCNALVHVIYSICSGQYSYLLKFRNKRCRPIFHKWTFSNMIKNICININPNPLIY